jgi:hypothetical protein
LSAFVCAFLEGRSPFLHPFVFWTFRIYLWAFVASLVGLMILALVVSAEWTAKDLYSEISDPRASPAEKRLTGIWCAGGGLLFSLVIAAAYSFELWGPVANIKVWFVVLCWMVLMVPYSILGYVVRLVLRRKSSLL